MRRDQAPLAVGIIDGEVTFLYQEDIIDEAILSAQALKCLDDVFGQPLPALPGWQDEEFRCFACLDLACRDYECRKERGICCLCCDHKPCYIEFSRGAYA